MKKLLFLLVILVFFAQLTVAEENILELKIEDMPVIVKAGAPLDFVYYAGNRAGPPCTGYVSYWIEVDNEKVSKGSDNIFLDSDETKSGNANVLLPSHLEGIYNFLIELKCNDANVLANKTIEVRKIVPVMPQLGAIILDGLDEGGQLGFAYSIKTNDVDETPIQLHEQITKDGEVVWSNSQNIAVSGINEITRLGPSLPIGNYKLMVTTLSGTESAKLIKDFSVNALPLTPPPFPFELLQTIAIIVLVALLFAGIFFTTKRFAGGKYPMKIMPSETLVDGVEDEDRVRLFAAESEGTANDYDVGWILDKLGLKAEVRENAMEFAARTNVLQSVKCCLVVTKKGEASFETTVMVTIENNTNRNWLNAKVAVKIPRFFGKTFLEKSEDTKINVKKFDSVAEFILEKVGAMKLTTFSYTVPLLISQPEANSVPLPAVIGYEEGEPLVITIVNIEKEKEHKKQFKAEKESGKQTKAEKKLKEKIKIYKKYISKNKKR